MTKNRVSFFFFLFIVPLENFSLIWRPIAMLGTLSLLQWEFFSVPPYCDTGHLFIMVITEDPDTHTYCRVISSGAVTTCFYDLVCRGWVSNTQPFAWGALTHCTTAAVTCVLNILSSKTPDISYKCEKKYLTISPCVPKNDLSLTEFSSFDFVTT